jgi:hypothetical protein
MKDPIGVFGRRWGFSVLGGAGSHRGARHGREQRRRFALPISALLSRIRKLVPRRQDSHYEEIVRGFGNGTLRPPATPMTDRELSRAIAAFLKKAPSEASVSTLGRRLDPSSRI